MGICDVRNRRAIKSPDIYAPIVNACLRYPFLSRIAPVHAFISACVCLWPAGVSLILRRCRLAQIPFSVVERLRRLLMINENLIALFESQNKAVHVNRVFLAVANPDAPYCIEALGEFTPPRIPFVLVYGLKVFGIDKCELPLAQRDFTVRLVRGCHRSLHSGWLWFSRCFSTDTLILTPFCPLSNAVIAP